MLREAAELGLHGNGNGAVLVACWQRQRQGQGLWQCQWQWQRRAKGFGLVWRDEEGATEAKICTVGPKINQDSKRVFMELGLILNRRTIEEAKKDFFH
ncbi:hypothetical protein SDJN02_06815, partial [Cucurbita argyrosperma subsp. argyrosperma]